MGVSPTPELTQDRGLPSTEQAGEEEAAGGTRLATYLPCTACASQIAHHVQPIRAGGAYDASGSLTPGPQD
jgi:hypothetical protein